jgi:hypothetical protein
VPAPVVTVSFLWAQAPKLKAVAKTATIMISLNSFNPLASFRSRLLPASLGRELQGSNVFLDFFGCVKRRDCQPPSRKKLAELQSVKRFRAPILQ